MSIRALNPYLHFNGEAEQVIELYQQALGASVERIQRYGEMPPEAQQGPTLSAEDQRRVLHSSLRIGGGIVMISDAPPNHAVEPGGNHQICVHFSDVADLDKRFAALAAGGRITMPLHDAFWGARFGMLVDKFGVAWMFTSEVKQV